MHCIFTMNDSEFCVVCVYLLMELKTGTHVHRQCTCIVHMDMLKCLLTNH